MAGFVFWITVPGVYSVICVMRIKRSPTASDRRLPPRGKPRSALGTCPRVLDQLAPGAGEELGDSNRR